MHPLFYLFLLFLFSACSTSSTPYTKKANTQKQIQSNQSIATDAQNEYKRLQEQRKSE